MKKFQTKLMSMVVIMLIMMMLLPTQIASAVNANNTANIEMQIIETENNYNIYLKDYKESFKWAIMDAGDYTELDIHYDDAQVDSDGNLYITIAKNNNANEFLYVKNSEGTKIQKVDYGTAFSIKDMEYVENTTNRIATELKTNLSSKDEVVDGLRTVVTVGGLEIEENEGAKYYCAITKLPATDEYNRLKELADKINSDFDNKEIDMYSKIETAKEFKTLYNTLESKQDWKEVTKVNGKLIIVQPDTAKKDEEYVVYIKEEKQNSEKTDVKFMKSYREEEEDKIPGKTETKVVKETTKLPITGDSIILFIILAIILVVAIIVFVRMKKIQKNNEGK